MSLISYRELALYCSFFIINYCSSNPFFLIERPRLTSQWRVLWLVLHYPFQCFVLACCSQQLQLLQETWCRSRVCYFRARYFLDSLAELLLVIRMLFLILSWVAGKISCVFIVLKCMITTDTHLNFKQDRLLFSEPSLL